jgi:hypothetical protein
MHRCKPWFLLFSALFLCMGAFPSAHQPPNDSLRDSECVRCHTDVKGLIRLGWEIEKIKGKPAESSETQGEG